MFTPTSNRFSNVKGLIDWMVFYAAFNPSSKVTITTWFSVCLEWRCVSTALACENAFNLISVISRRQRAYSCISRVSPVLGWGSEVFCPMTISWNEPRGSSDVRNRYPQVKSHTLYHWPTQDSVLPLPTLFPSPTLNQKGTQTTRADRF